MDDTELFSRPQRFARVDRLVIILRGLPGSGKSTIANNIKKLEAKFDKKTKIFTWDDYFEEVNYVFIKYALPVPTGSGTIKFKNYHNIR